MLWVSGDLLGVFAQDTIRSGFAIVTVVSGNLGGLIATETLKNATISGLEQAIVAPSALITSASVLVPVAPDSMAGIAIANPSSGSGGVNLILTDSGGNVVLNSVVQVGPHGHFTKFINELFAVPPTGFPAPLLLTISSEIPITVLVMNFQNGGFTSIPFTSLSFTTPVAVQSLTTTPSNAPSATSFALTPSPTTNFAVGLPPIFPIFPPTMAPATVTTSPVPTTALIGGSAVVFAQVAAGGGWSTEIAIGNTSAGTQVVRIDFFGADGVNTSSLTDINIPPHGVFFISSVQP
jgi:hypothetical protein